MNHGLDIVAGTPRVAAMRFGGRKRRGGGNSMIAAAFTMGCGVVAAVVRFGLDLLLRPVAMVAGWIVSRDDLDGY